MLTDPTLTGYLANLGSELTGAVITALRRRAEEFALGTPRYQALKRCYAAAEAALLPPNDPFFAPYRPILQNYLADPDVGRELAKLARGNPPDAATLVDLWADFTADRGDLPPFDLSPRLAAALEAFLQMAEQEEALQPAIQTAQLRDQTELLRRLPENMAAAVANQVRAIRSGDVTFWQNAVIHGDIVTGLKIEKIEINPPSPPPPDPCLELGRRYLLALQAEVNHLPLAELEDEGARQRSTPLTLNRVYIELDTTTRVPLSQTEKEQAEFRFDRERPLTALEIARQQPRLVLTGAPGGGKSAFVNYLAYRLAEAHLTPAQTDFVWPAPYPWPIRLILRDLAADLNLAQLAAWPAARQRVELRQTCLSQRLKEFQRTYGLTPAEAEQWSTCLAHRPTLTIFDGLDEVSPEHLPFIRTMIEAVADHHPGPILVTCRIRSYQGMPPLAGFSQATLANLTQAQIDAFIEHWYTAQAHIPPAERPNRIANLRQAVRSETLAELVGNPLLLTTMALVHTADVRLPDRRVELYQRSVDVLLRRWQTHKFGQQAILHQLGVDPQLLLRGLWRLAYEAHQTGRSGQQADVNEDMASGILARTCFNGDRGKADQFLGYVDRQAGLLVGRGGSETEPRQYTFAHRTFQEYLAGCHLAMNHDQGRLADALAGKLAEGERWYLAGQLAAHHLLYNVGLDRDVYELLRRLCPVRPPQTEAEWRGTAWAGILAAEMGSARLCGDAHPDGGAELLARLTPRLETIVGRGMLTVAERADAGDALAALNADTRPGVGPISPLPKGRVPVRVEGPGVRALELCYIPPGPFWLGSREGEDDLARNDEYGHDQPYDLAYPYWLSRYPVTQAQYHAFVAATGHRVPYREEDWAHPYNWRDGAPPPHRRNHPVVLVSWPDARAYCQWLTDQLTATGQLSIWQEYWVALNNPSKIPNTLAGTNRKSKIVNRKSKIVVRLPTEAEWEKAARGGLEIPVEPAIISVGAKGCSPLPERGLLMQPNPFPERRWSWGEWTDDSPQRHANVFETNRGGTMAAGSFPAGASPYGCMDMSGNVWEWTHSQYRLYPYRADDGREGEATETDVRYTVRGGSWFNYQGNARVSYRTHYYPDNFDLTNGFRCVVAPIFLA